MIDRFDLGLYELAFGSAERPPDDTALVEWPVEFFQSWLIRPN
jgi:hypothetical protein